MNAYARNFYFLAATAAATISCGDNNNVVIDAAKPDAQKIDARVDAPPATPTAVTNFQATAGLPKEIGLSWNNPATPAPAGVLIVASRTPITFVPADGTAYTLAQIISGDLTVVSIANATSATFKPACQAGGHKFRTDSVAIFAAPFATRPGKMRPGYGRNEIVG